jgi:hypothetical protein
MEIFIESSSNNAIIVDADTKLFKKVVQIGSQPRILDPWVSILLVFASFGHEDEDLASSLDMMLERIKFVL